MTQKFYQGSSKARGSGIGLAVCDEIVRLHGGTFDIGNAEGGGAVVTVRLPEKKENKCLIFKMRYAILHGKGNRLWLKNSSAGAPSAPASADRRLLREF